MGLMTTQESYPGTYRGSIIDHGLSLTKNDYPQWIATLHAEEYWDEEEKVWVSWTDRTDTDITARLVLAGSNEQEIFHCKNLEKAIGWDGESWKSLAELDLTETKIQFRVEEHIYNEVISLQVAGINHYDAEPGHTIQKLNAPEIKDLDAKFASFFRKRKGEKKPIKPIGKPIIPKPETDETRPNLPSPPEKKTKGKKVKGCTQQEAWKACKKAKDESVSDKQLAEVWLQTVETLAPNGDEEQMNNELWARVRDIVVEQVKSDIPF